MTFMACKKLLQMILGSARGYNEKKEIKYPFVVVCAAGVDGVCPKKRNPLTITPHCWRIKI